MVEALIIEMIYVLKILEYEFLIKFCLFYFIFLLFK